MNFEFARENMIKQQVMPEGIEVGGLIDAMSKVAREDFLPLQYKSLAYCDTALTVSGKELKSPMFTAKLIYALKIDSKETVLKLGIESGYTAALLGRVAKKVEVVDHDEEEREEVGYLLANANIANVKLSDTDHLADIIESNKRFDCIYISSVLAEKELDESLFELLEIGGRVVFVIKSSVCDRAYLTTRVDEKSYKKEFLFDIYNK
ncbi:protein-L-isoaspartate O-methyltransferase [Francisellaceae bacterium CB52]|jgi:protein-L-isoaspartate(D-aspartate) O-methyltransferase